MVLLQKYNSFKYLKTLFVKNNIKTLYTNFPEKLSDITSRNSTKDRRSYFRISG
ncbi:hypothetical protein GLOIN_2v1593198 [Rhizophagus irregularis DAOM 181602=DAOM 197198]|uniref:Uncharacterized protein n=1 Tax=Rhizophagus irregularis (strain DAOM 181602 / DAOM 197198 / MUCL 43194) TaxID=747089 RepID=A0A2P4Q524_RHIID|nr:hypothetical protein GLOIN_2v1593198 [Rhizophagus irregularis DAOM 181602=DAOM 197198]POG72736.1 hypothetical protein GLOIN_2v1593198 [Rhizophagus irregularis DAOM 181602=DAOM 197198]|eukprot:XP_025179602.1 hypothetical protein GLOIN_2v1593198 [Rhizophagus irregularis DAOM 181602=DAOM 197198]